MNRNQINAAFELKGIEFNVNLQSILDGLGSSLSVESLVNRFDRVIGITVVDWSGGNALMHWALYPGCTEPTKAGMYQQIAYVAQLDEDSASRLADC